VSQWDGIPITVAPHETIEISNSTPIAGAGHAIAIKMTGELVDKIMIGEIKEEELKHADVAYYRSPRGTSIGIPTARKPYEDRILKELKTDEESPSVQAMRKKLLAEISGNNEAQVESKPVQVPSQAEFADVMKANEKIVAKKEPVKTHIIK
jgi:hypothetical protein